MLELIYSIEDPSLPLPSPIKHFAVELVEKAIVFCSQGEIITMHYEIEWELYKIELCSDCSNETYGTKKCQQLSIREPLVEPGKRYTFRVCAIGKSGAGK